MQRDFVRCKARQAFRRGAPFVDYGPARKPPQNATAKAIAYVIELWEKSGKGK